MAMTSKQAFAAYGEPICQEAYELSQKGTDIRAIADDLDLTVRQAKVAVKAWEQHLKDRQPKTH